MEELVRVQFSFSATSPATVVSVSRDISGTAPEEVVDDTPFSFAYTGRHDNGELPTSTVSSPFSHLLAAVDVRPPLGFCITYGPEYFFTFRIANVLPNRWRCVRTTGGKGAVPAGYHSCCRGSDLRRSSSTTSGTSGSNTVARVSSSRQCVCTFVYVSGSGFNLMCIHCRTPTVTGTQPHNSTVKLQTIST